MNMFRLNKKSITMILFREFLKKLLSKVNIIKLLKNSQVRPAAILAIKAKVKAVDQVAQVEPVGEVEVPVMKGK